MKSKNLNILLADDDHDDCMFFKQALEELDTTSNLTTVHDGEQLMDYLNSAVAENVGAVGAEDFLPLQPLPDIIFLDINMPRKNGIECLAEIKRNEKLKLIPVVMFSTTNSWDTINQLFKSGSNVYIHKPSDFTQLKQVINHALPIASENDFSKVKVKYVLNA